MTKGSNLPSRWRDEVPAIENSKPRPRWSVMIPTYRCARFLPETLKSVLDQDIGPEAMQIEVVDDASDDDPEAVVRTIGRGRVNFVRQPYNVGHISNFHTCLTRAKGDIVHLLHGDDIVRPGFYSALVRGFEDIPNLGAAFCRSVYINQDGFELGIVPEELPKAGLLPDALARLAVEQRIMTPSVVVRRSVYETLGGFDKRLSCSEDWEMWVRIAASYPIWYEPRPLALYRVHAHSNTGRNVRTAEDMFHTRMAIGIFRGYLPPDRASSIVSQARHTYASSALRTARQLLQQGDRAGSYAQAVEAIRLAPSLPIVYRALAIFLKRRHVDAQSK